MSQTSGTVTFEDVKGKRSKMNFHDVVDITKLEDLANSLANLTRCKVVNISFHESKDVSIGAAAAGQFDTVDDKARLVIEDPTTGRSGQPQLPAPLENLFTHVEKVGYVLLKATGDQIADFISLACGRTGTEKFRFVKGKHSKNNTEAQI